MPESAVPNNSISNICLNLININYASSSILSVVTDLFASELCKKMSRIQANTVDSAQDRAI